MIADSAKKKKIDVDDKKKENSDGQEMDTVKLQM